MPYKLHTQQSIQYTLFTFYTTQHSTVYTIDSIHYITYSIYYTIYYIAYNIPYHILQSIHYTVYTTHYTLYILISIV